MGTDFINGLGSRTSLICTVPGAESRGLTPEELRLLACAGQGTPLGEVILGSGLPEARAIALLLGLRLRGVIQPGGVRRSATPASIPRQPTPPLGRPTPSTPPLGRATPSTPPMARPASSATPAAPMRLKTSGPLPVDPAALTELVDLDLDRKQEILEVDQRCVGEDYFRMLGLAPGAAAPDVKKAYYELSKRFHPDRYFGRSLGSYKARIDRIFRKLTEAQAVLSDPQRRQTYLAQHPEMAESAEPSAELDPARAAERRARLARHPYLAKVAKVHELAQRGRELLEKREFGRAFTDLNLASQIDPKNKEVADLLHSAKKGADQARAAKEFEEGENAERMSNGAEALAHLRNAAQLDPSNADYAARLTRALLSIGGAAELKEAHNMARRAAELKPQSADHRLLFAKVLFRAGLEKNAQREFEAVLKLRPDDPVAKEHLKKLRWRF